jgi:hypothetical protein
VRRADVNQSVCVKTYELRPETRPKRDDEEEEREDLVPSLQICDNLRVHGMNRKDQRRDKRDHGGVRKELLPQEKKEKRHDAGVKKDVDEMAYRKVEIEQALLDRKGYLRQRAPTAT